jgi:hypothetical protein
MLLRRQINYIPVRFYAIIDDAGHFNSRQNTALSSDISVPSQGSILLSLTRQYWITSRGDFAEDGDLTQPQASWTGGMRPHHTAWLEVRKGVLK